jgi:hypothetical protein
LVENGYAGFFGFNSAQIRNELLNSAKPAADNNHQFAGYASMSGAAGHGHGDHGQNQSLLFGDGGGKGRNVKAVKGIQNWEYDIPTDRDWELPRENVTLSRHVLGEGEFGRIVSATVKDLCPQQPGFETTVAVKMLKGLFSISFFD